MPIRVRNSFPPEQPEPRFVWVFDDAGIQTVAEGWKNAFESCLSAEDQLTPEQPMTFMSGV